MVPKLALSIRQPWAILAATGFKPVENRTQPPPKAMIGRRFYIHAALKEDLKAFFAFTEMAGVRCEIPFPLVYGAIIGEATLAADKTDYPSRWFTGPHGWILADPVPYCNPTHCKGKLGFWKPDVEVKRG